MKPASMTGYYRLAIVLAAIAIALAWSAVGAWIFG
jgi:hypothetical protein